MGDAADGGLSATLQYNSELFLSSTMARMAEHYCNVLRHITHMYVASASGCVHMTHLDVCIYVCCVVQGGHTYQRAPAPDHI